MQSLQKKELKAVHTSDLQEILKKFNQLDDFINNKLTCRICKQTIRNDNIGSVQLLDEKLHFTCNDAKCYADAVRDVKQTNIE